MCGHLFHSILCKACSLGFDDDYDYKNNDPILLIFCVCKCDDFTPTHGHYLGASTTIPWVGLKYVREPAHLVGHCIAINVHI